jgi:mitochondrial splicing suppressor protein 51
MDSIYGGAPDGRRGFEPFLRKVRSKHGLLPSWWSEEKAAECVRFGMKEGEWSELARAVKKSDVIEHYGNPVMPIQLRMFKEQVYGRGPGGMSGAGMLKAQMIAENGNEGIHLRNFDFNSAFSRP